MDFKVTLVGAGNMGGAMLRGWLSNGMKPEQVTVIDPSPSDAMKDYLSLEQIVCESSADKLDTTDVLLVAVKPQMMEKVLPGLRPLIGDDTVIVSVAAGTQLETLTKPFGNVAAIRVMPNTPSLVGRGMSVGCPNAKATSKHKKHVGQLMQAIGHMEWVDEEALIDAVTAVSGSGPAYVFHLAECMAAAGVKAGLPHDLAMTLARETVSGAGELLRQSEDDPTTLRKNVTSPGGTTAAALEVLMGEGGMPALFEDAIAAAKQRSEELS